MNPVQKNWTAFPHVQPPTGSNGRAQTQPSFWRCFKQTHVHLHLQFRNPDQLHPKPSLQEPQQAFVPSYIYTSKKARLQPQCSCTDSKKIVWALELIGTYLGLFNNNNSNNNNSDNNKLSQNCIQCQDKIIDPDVVVINFATRPLSSNHRPKYPNATGALPAHHDPWPHCSSSQENLNTYKIGCFAKIISLSSSLTKTAQL